MFSSIVSVVGGYLGMAVVVMIGTAIATAAFIPGGFAGTKNLQGQLPTNYLYSNLALSFVGAVFGGWLTARLAPAHPVYHAVALAAFLLVMSALSAKTQMSKQPPWYPWTIAAIGVAGVLLGGIWEAWPWASP